MKTFRIEVTTRTSVSIVEIQAENFDEVKNKIAVLYRGKLILKLVEL